MARARFFAERLGLTDDERHELAMMLPGRHGEPVSWGRLSDDEVAVLCAWLRGASLVVDLYLLRADIRKGG